MIFQHIIQFAKRLEHWAMVGHIWHSNHKRRQQYKKRRRHDLRLQLDAWKTEMKEVRRANRRAKIDHWKQVYQDWLKGWEEELQHPWRPSLFPTHRLDMSNSSSNRLSEHHAILRDLDYDNLNKYFFG